jgi:hypothetical protein
MMMMLLMMTMMMTMMMPSTEGGATPVMALPRTKQETSRPVAGGPHTPSEFALSVSCVGS